MVEIKWIRNIRVIKTNKWVKNKIIKSNIN
jgi:hypothetical protein